MLKPLKDNVYVRIIKEELKKGELLLAEPKRKKILKAEVLAIGPGEIRDGQLLPLDVKIGDVILIPNHVGNTISDEAGKEEIIIPESQIIGVLE